MEYRRNKNSHALTVKAKGILDVILTEISITEASDHTRKFTTKGIWDTGASKSVITQEVLDELKLPVKGITTVNTATVSGVKKPTYLIDIFLKPDLVVQGLTVTVGNVAAEHGVNCLIGMDIIGIGDFSITNLNGNTWFSFRFPSEHEVDFVAPIEKFNAKIKMHFDAGRGMNGKCICGSGKKFKNCHGVDVEILKATS